MDYFHAVMAVSAVLSAGLAYSRPRPHHLLLLAAVWIGSSVLQAWRYWMARSEDAMWMIGLSVVVVANLIAQVVGGIVGLIAGHFLRG